MHSLGMAENILQLALAEAQKHEGKRIASIRVTIPDHDSEESDAIQFCLEAMTRGTPAEGAEINIEVVPIMARCSACVIDFVVDPHLPSRCPRCGGTVPPPPHDEDFPAITIELGNV
ncbi:MAG: hydrogenase maturation nickel metallochaperone HypA [Chloroflexi bacterium]|nr:hydrogenase maturation nickel metallochaperone HypA [Chloroflexota bacterium]